MQARNLGRTTFGLAAAVGTCGLGFTAFQVTPGHSGAYCVMLTVSFATTGIVAALGLALDYRFGCQALRAQAAAASRDADLQRARLELQRSILGKIPDGTRGAQAYQAMAVADALYLAVMPKRGETAGQRVSE